VQFTANTRIDGAFATYSTCGRTVHCLLPLVHRTCMQMLAVHRHCRYDYKHGGTEENVG